jgi:hypothetical protein
MTFEAPEVIEYVPAAQDKHKAMDEAPTLVEYLPAAQRVQLALVEMPVPVL